MPSPAANLTCILAATLALSTVVGCHAKSGNDETGASQKAGQKSSGNGAHQLAEPAESTTGVPSGPTAAASDDGSPQAVGHTSTAMPGAPQATLNGKPQQDKKLDNTESPSSPRLHPQ